MLIFGSDAFFEPELNYTPPVCLCTFHFLDWIMVRLHHPPEYNLKTCANVHLEVQPGQ